MTLFKTKSLQGAKDTLIAGERPAEMSANISKSNCNKSNHNLKEGIMKTLFKKSGLLILATLLLSSSAYSLKIIPHMTEGALAQFGLTRAFDLDGLNLDDFRLGNSATAVDCAKIKDEVPQLLKTTEAGAACAAIAEVEKHIRTDVVVNIEFAAGNLEAVLGVPALGFAQSSTALISHKSNSEENFTYGYQTVMKMLKVQNASEHQNRENIITHLPNISQLQTDYPPGSFFDGANEEYADGKFVPGTIKLNTSQLRALGVAPGGASNNIDPVGFGAIPGTDGFAVLVMPETALFDVVWDFDTTDNVGMITDLTKADWDVINFTDDETWPAGFLLTPRFFDFKGVIMHEILHNLGVSSRVDGFEQNRDGETTIMTKAERSVRVIDLFRVSQSTANQIHTFGDFTGAQRYLKVDGPLNGRCDVDNGKAVAVIDIVDGQAITIPLTSGTREDSEEICIAGDCLQASHLRNAYSAIRADEVNCSGAFIGVRFHEDPPGMLMAPVGLDHNPEILTERDLRILDVIGWNIDYDGTQPTSLDGGNNNASNANLMSQEEFEQKENVSVQFGSSLIID